MAENTPPRAPNKTLSRRSFLKKAGILAGGTAVLGVPAVAKVLQEVKKAEEHGTVTTKESWDRDDALRSFIADDPAQVTMVGVDHDNTEKAFYFWLVLNAEPLKEAGISKVFVEVNTDFADLFKKASDKEITKDSFVKEYLEMYPDDKEWRASAPAQEIENVEKTKAHIFYAITALKNKGISVVPYDRRFEGNLQEKERFLAQMARSKKKLESVLDKRLGDPLSFKNIARLIFKGGKSLTVSRATEVRQETANLLKEGAPEALRFRDISEQSLANDALNLAYIKEHSRPDERILVVAGDWHIQKIGGLRSLFDKGKMKTKSISYIPDLLPGSMQAYIEDVKNQPLFDAIQPDAYLSAKTGELVRANNQAPAQENRPQHSVQPKVAHKNPSVG